MKSRRPSALKPGNLNLARAAKNLTAATPGLGASVCYPPKKHQQSIMNTLRRTHQATAFPGSDALAPPGSVGQVSNQQAEQLLRRKDDLHVEYWNVRTLQDVGVQALTVREQCGGGEGLIL